MNESYRELAEYYGTAIVPARVRKPQDKSIVEKSVGFSTTWITAAMRERKFFSLAEVKEAVAERLEIINTTPFQKRPGNRREAYLNEEKEFMLPLPSVPYEPAVWKQATVRNDYLISDGQNKYSVPYDLIGEKVQLRLTKNTVEIFFKGERVASHHRLTVFQTQPVVKPEHMPEKHRRYLRYNADDFRLWAKNIGNSVERVVDYFLKSGSSQEQDYKSCVALMKYGKKYGKEKLERACEGMLEISTVPSIRTIAIILKNGKEPERKTTSPTTAKNTASHAAPPISRRAVSVMLDKSTVEKLRGMNLSAFAAELERQMSDSSFSQMAFEDRLGLLVDSEWNRRRNNKLIRLIKRAAFSTPSATVEGIEYIEDRHLDKKQILRFAACSYINEGHYIILKGASGNGKTYIACALGNAACRKFKTVRYIRTPELLDELSIAKPNGELKDTIRAYAKLDLLILDEWLIRRLSYNEAYDLLEIVEARENRSMIFCTQYETEGWYSRIHPDEDNDSPISEAIMDRIIHNSYIVAIDGKCSMRERHGLNTEVSP